MTFQQPVLFMELLILIILSWISLKFRFLEPSGVVSALIIGFIVIVFGGLGWFLLLLSFYLISSLFTKYKYDFKRALGFAEAKGGARSWRNVIGNGGAAALFALGEGVFGGGIFFAAFLGSISTAVSDTLATEVGLLYPGKPRLITNFKTVEPGFSGAISPYGEVAIILSSLLMGISAAILRIEPGFSFVKVVCIAVLSGFIGSTIDSLLGATLQAGYWCDKCNSFSEDPIHNCGCEARFFKGVRFINNHVVNFASTFIGGFAGLLLSLILP
ncbi:MAG: DUF92 domain-containing protein [archaeon YNP-LCB-003-016]|uniref:DUF92 domain-containing protein n=1 Tax=Candidatus Culexarchaeum yellowstonense TaxID=2928963 RepID=UPI0026F278D3|nr:DUF92 domain-containing protein [Candidatus Culexarchaeum yellowstonense]MCR6691744.1 DUF92 domain-containing protein [Candidatus Culexarchaeum yellowstonense]